MNDVLGVNAEQLMAGYRRRSFSPVEVICAVLDRVALFNPLVNGVCSLDEDSALAAARESERRWMRGEPCGLLDGVPVSVKDLVAVRGLPTRYGSLTSPSAPEADDAPRSRDCDRPARCCSARLRPRSLATRSSRTACSPALPVTHGIGV